jgi:hypothetical protein
VDEKKPARGGLCYILRMDYTDWLWLKLGIVIVAAFLYGLFGGNVNGPEE